MGVPGYASPSEATAMGNIMIQLKAEGKVKDIKEMRELIAKAVEMKKFEPADTQSWEKAYEKFAEICK